MNKCVILVLALSLFSGCASGSKTPDSPESSTTSGTPPNESAQAGETPTAKEPPVAKAPPAKTYTSASQSPEKVTLKAKPGNITFNHKAHGQRTDCSVCHGDKIGKIAPLGRDAGHKMCLDCHKQKKAGPTKCGDCHKK